MAHLPSDLSYRRVARLALPIVVGGLAQNVVMATDALFLAGQSQVSLDAVGIAGLLFTTLVIIGFGLSVGLQVIVARRMGEADPQGVGATFNVGMLVLLALSLLTFVFLQWGSETILQTLVESAAVAEEAKQYLSYRNPSVWFALTGLTYRAFFIGIAETRIISTATLVMAGSNILFNYVLIFGHWGFPEMGIAGAGLASALSEVVCWFYTLGYLLRKKYHRRFPLFRFKRLLLADLKPVFHVASPVMMQFFLSHAAWFLFFIIIEKSGELALAVSVIIRIIYMFEMTPFWGLGSAVNSLVSFSLGEKKPELVYPLLYRVIRFSLLFLVPLVLLNLFFGHWLLQTLAASVELADAGIATLYMVTAALVLFAMANLYFNALMGTGATKIALLIEVFVIAIYMLLSWWLGLHLKAAVHWIWGTELAYFALMGLCASLYLRSGRWKKLTF